MKSVRTDDVGKLVLRVSLGGLMLFHGVSKLRHGIGGIARSVHAKGLPHFFAYGVYLGEVVAPLLIIVGIGTRPASAVLAFNMLVAIWLAHARDVFHLSRSGGWAIELAMLYLLGALSVAWLGSGRYALSRGRGPLDGA